MSSSRAILGSSAALVRIGLIVRLATGAAGLQAQAVPRGEYLDQLPPLPRRISQTEASARLHLFGDRGAVHYRDVEPADGVDDARGAVLLALADRFSPILRRNNFSRPTDFLSAGRSQLWLQVDEWMAGKVLRTDSLVLGGPIRAAAPILTLGNDQGLTALLRRFSPDAAAGNVEPAEGAKDTVLFIDFPGEDERSWRRAHRSGHELRAYVHPFIDEDRTAGDDRYALVLQYWFFYPFNDSGNDHEGDWEHISVIVTTTDRERAPTLRAARVNELRLQRIVAGSMPLDSLAVAAVEYYFHETYAVIDYLAARREAPHATGAGEIAHLHIWEEPDLINRTIRGRLSDARLATHPIGYIGGNNRGPAELTKLWPRFQAAYNRNSNGTYPFPGTWQAVGPLGLTEQVSGARVPALSKHAGGQLVFEDEHFFAFQATDLTLVPDWERVWPAMLDDAGLRAEWAWLFLPLRWGYPASRSPGAGAIKHVNLGNISPAGPAFQVTWNRLGPATSWRAYDPNALRVLLVPTVPWARVRNGWGFLNVPVGLLEIVPGWNVLTSQAIPWLAGSLHLFGAAPATTFYPDEPPFRFTSIGAGVASTTDVDELARVLPAAASPNGIVPGSGFPPGRAEPSLSQRYWLNVFYSRTLSLENTFSLSRANLSGFRSLPTDLSTPDLLGTLALRELTSGFRLNVGSTNDDVRQYYGRAGWGYTWYELRDLTVQGEPFSGSSRRDGGYAPTWFPSTKWWPNTWYLGAGIEVFRPKHHRLLQRMGLGARVEGSLSWHRLELTEPSIDLGWIQKGEVALAFSLAW